MNYIDMGRTGKDNNKKLADLLLYITPDDEMDTATTLELRHDLQDFIKEHRPKYEIWLFGFNDEKPPVQMS